MISCGLKWLIILRVSGKRFAGLKYKRLFLKSFKIGVCYPVEQTLLDTSPTGKITRIPNAPRLGLFAPVAVDG